MSDTAATTEAAGSAVLSGGRRICLWAVLLLGLALRLVFWGAVAEHPERVLFLSFHHNDAHGYQQLAENLLEGRGFSQSRSTPFQPDFIRTPGYPGFLAACYLVFGRRALAALLVQALFGAATVWLCWRLAARHGFRVGLVAASFLALDASSILWGSFLISDTLAALLVTAAVYVWSGDGARRALLGGLLVGLAGLTRPIALYLFVPFLLDSLVWYRGARRRQGWTRIGALALGVALSAGPWIVRNIVQGGPVGVSSIAENNLLHFRAAGAMVAYHREMTLEDAQAILDAEFARRLPPRATPREIAALQRELAFEVLWNYKGSAILMTLEGLGQMLSGSEFPWFSYRFWGVHSWQPSVSVALREKGLTAALEVLAGRGWTGALHVLLRAWEGGLPWLLYLAALVGVPRAWKRPRLRRSMLLYLACVGVLLGLASGRDSCPRFRVPAAPCLALLAGFGLGLPRRNSGSEAV